MVIVQIKLMQEYVHMRKGVENCFRATHNEVIWKCINHFNGLYLKVYYTNTEILFAHCKTCALLSLCQPSPEV
jgi:hypothetical protein